MNPHFQQPITFLLFIRQRRYTTIEKMWSDASNRVAICIFLLQPPCISLAFIHELHFLHEVHKRKFPSTQRYILNQPINNQTQSKINNEQDEIYHVHGFLKSMNQKKMLKMEPQVGFAPTKLSRPKINLLYNYRSMFLEKRSSLCLLRNCGKIT